MRLDKYLLKNGFVDSRNKASELIRRSAVFVDDKLITKSSFDVEDNVRIKIESQIYVSRAAWKLKYFLENIRLNIRDTDCLDIGSSTGGFTEILLENGALKVTCVDVGSNQLHKSLRIRSDVLVYENMDIRDFKTNKQYDLVVCDVSFISISKIIYTIKSLAKKDIILLFKPQFEVGRDAKRTSRGVIKNQKDTNNAFLEFEQSLCDNDLKIIFKKESQLCGKEGNIEQFYFINKS